MKPFLAVTLILVGLILILTPPASDAYYGFVVALASHQREPSSIILNMIGHTRMDDMYRFGCYFAGVALIGFVIHSSRGQLQAGSGELQKG